MSPFRLFSFLGNGIHFLSFFQSSLNPVRLHGCLSGRNTSRLKSYLSQPDVFQPSSSSSTQTKRYP